MDVVWRACFTYDEAMLKSHSFSLPTPPPCVDRWIEIRVDLSYLQGNKAAGLGRSLANDEEAEDPTSSAERHRRVFHRGRLMMMPASHTLNPGLKFVSDLIFSIFYTILYS